MLDPIGGIYANLIRSKLKSTNNDYADDDDDDDRPHPSQRVQFSWRARERERNIVKRAQLNSWRALIFLLRTQTTRSGSDAGLFAHVACVCESEQADGKSTEMSEIVRDRFAVLLISMCTLCVCVCVCVWANLMLPTRTANIEHRTCCMATCCRNMLDSELGLTSPQLTTEAEAEEEGSTPHLTCQPTLSTRQQRRRRS